MCYGFIFEVEDKQRDDMGIIETPYTERWTCKKTNFQTFGNERGSGSKHMTNRNRIVV
jgi:hypothetical protein